MADNSLYDILLSLPLFLGMSRNDLHEAAGKARFDFQKIAEGQTIVEEGERCLSLYFLLTGDIQVVTEADDHGDRKSTRLNSSHISRSRMPSSA